MDDLPMIPGPLKKTPITATYNGYETSISVTEAMYVKIMKENKGMNITGINMLSTVDGIGARAVVYVSGCAHHCEGCHNPETWDSAQGVNFTSERMDGLLKEFGDRVDILDGITFSGGDPLYPGNILDMWIFLRKFKDTFPDKNVWVYTGYTFDELMTCITTTSFNSMKYKRHNPSNTSKEYSRMLDEILKLTDVLVDGMYIKSLHSNITPFVGSTNQRLIDMKATLSDPDGDLIILKILND